MTKSSATIEKWHPCHLPFNMYDVSNKGNVRSWKNNRHGLAKIPRVLKIKPHSTGYRIATLSTDGSHKIKVSRLVVIAFLENPHEKKCVNHIDGDKANDNLDNLEWATHSENNKHAFDTGLNKQHKGEANKNSRLSEKDVLKIRGAWEKGEESMRSLGRKYKVSHTTISDIIHRRSWHTKRSE